MRIYLDSAPLIYLVENGVWGDCVMAMEGYDWGGQMFSYSIVAATLSR